MHSIWVLFYAFFLVGLFTFGGGYAMIPLITESIEKHGWTVGGMSITEFIGVAESTPGPFAVNISTFIGFNEKGFFGALGATLGVILPSFIIILIIASLGDKFLKTKIMQSALQGIRPVVVALVLSVVIEILLKNIFMMELNINKIKVGKFDLVSLIITVVIFGLSFVKYRDKKTNKLKKISPIILIILSGILGMFLYRI